MSVTLQQPPRLLALYRRLLNSGAILFKANQNSSSPSGSSSGSSAPNYELFMPMLVGCTEPILLAFAEIASLAHWKARETRNGTLSSRELIMRGTSIERALRSSCETSSAAFMGVNRTEAGSSLQGSLTQMSPEMTQRVIAAIYQETAVLYLNTVLSGSNPGASGSGCVCPRVRVWLTLRGLCRGPGDFELDEHDRAVGEPAAWGPDGLVAGAAARDGGVSSGRAGGAGYAEEAVAGDQRDELEYSAGGGADDGGLGAAGLDACARRVAKCNAGAGVVAAVGMNGKGGVLTFGRSPQTQHPTPTPTPPRR